FERVVRPVVCAPTQHALHVAVLVVILMVELSHCRCARLEYAPLEHSPGGRFHLCIDFDHDARGPWRSREAECKDCREKQGMNWSHWFVSLTRPYTLDKLSSNLCLAR